MGVWVGVGVGCVCVGGVCGGGVGVCVFVCGPDLINVIVTTGEGLLLYLWKEGLLIGLRIHYTTGIKIIRILGYEFMSKNTV